MSAAENRPLAHPRRLGSALPLAIASALAFAVPMTSMPSTGIAQALDVSITVAPPPLPVYAQPPIPDIDYIWVPGYWAWSPAGYYWVPGTWVLPPEPGLLWTPGYWAWNDGYYVWHAGYWGPTVGFYGGINYGFGYPGIGYFGGHWDHDHFFYNRAVNNFGGVHIANVYNDPVRNVSNNHIAFNGGHGGINARPTASEEAAAHEHHVDPTSTQTAHARAASENHALLASVNHGAPPIAATSHPSNFSGAGVVHARGAGTAPAHTNAVVRSAAAPAGPGAGAQPQHQPHQNVARPGGQPGGAPVRPAAVPHATAVQRHPQGAPHPQSGSHPVPVHAAAAPHAAAPHPAPAARPAPQPHPAPQGGGEDHGNDHGGGDHPHP